MEIMGMVMAAMKERRSRAEIEAALVRAGHSRDVVKTSPVTTTAPLAGILDDSVVKMVAKSSAEALEVNKRILAALERQNALLDCQNMLLEKLTRAGVALPGETLSNSRQEAQEGPGEGQEVVPAVPVPENASEGNPRPSWWKQLWRRKP